MKTRLFDTTALFDFLPRSVCFIEGNGDTFAPEPPAAGAPPPGAETPEEPELVFEDDNPAPNEGDGDDLDDLEIGPAKHRVPKPVKEAWQGLQKTTQSEKEAVAAERKAIEADRARYQENMRVAATYMKEIGRIQTIDEQLAEYEKLTPADWMAWAEQDREAAAKAQIGLGALRAERDKLLRSVNEKEGKIKADREREKTEAAAKAERELATKFKDWSPQKKESLLKVGSDFGYTAEELQMVSHDPRLYAVFDEVRQFREAKARAKKVTEEAKAAAAASGKPEPVHRTRGTAGSATSLGDNVSMENWAERFTKQRSVHMKSRLR